MSKKLIESIKSSVTKLANSVKDSQLSKAKQSIINIENSTFFGILLKGLINNWISVVIVGLLLGYSINLYMYNKTLENEALKVDVARLHSIIETNENINDELRTRIKKLEDQKSYNLKNNKKYKESLTKLDSDQLKTRILDHVKRLKKRRGM